MDINGNWGRRLNAAGVSAKDPETYVYAKYLCLLDLLKLDHLYIISICWSIAAVYGQH